MESIRSPRYIRCLRWIAVHGSLRRTYTGTDTGPRSLNVSSVSSLIEVRAEAAALTDSSGTTTCPKHLPRCVRFYPRPLIASSRSTAVEPEYEYEATL